MERRRLRMRVIIGVDGEGNNLYSSRTFSNVNTEATDENLVNVGMVFASLIDPAVETLTRIDEATL